MDLLERIAVLVIVFGAFLIVDVRDLRRYDRKEHLVYAAFMGFALYLAADYLLKVKLPHMDELVDWVFTGPGKHIANYLGGHS